MKTIKHIKKISYLILLLWMQPAEAQLMAESIGFGIQAGSMGVGVHLKTGLNPKSNLKFFMNYWSYERLKNNEGISNFSQFETNVKLGAVGVQYARQVFDKLKFLEINGGIQYQWNRMTESRSYQMLRNNETTDLGNLTIEISTSPIVPFISVSAGNFQSEKNWKISGELGVNYHGKPRVNFTGTGMIAPTAEQDEIVVNNLNAYRFYPIINLCLTYQIKQQ